MKVLYNWLKEYIDIKVSPEELIDVFTHLGMEVEEARDLKEGLSGLKTAVIEEVKDHPADPHYKVVHLRLKDGTLRCVSGSKGLEKGKFVFVATPGTRLSGRIVDKKDIKGVLSEGNIVSLEDLGLEDRSETVFFPEGVDLNTSPVEYLGLNDYLYDLYITPNRPDLLGYLGIAAELGAFYKEKVHIPPYGVEEERMDVPYIQIADPEGCPRYTGRVILNVKVFDSPFWMRRKLYLSGIRPISNVVDVTNYVLLELGHPLHAFDLNKIDEIIVRKAKKDEKILALDGKEYLLTEDTLIIADSRKPIAIAGIIGGEESSVNDDTTSIFLESAYFDAATVAKSVFKYGLRTESGIRFMKGADPCIPPMASSRAARLIQEVAGGRVSQLVDIRLKELGERKIRVRFERISSLIGEKIADEKIKDLLDRFDFSYEEIGNGTYEVRIPSRRRDIEGEADIAEEYLRLHGYDWVTDRIHVPDNHPGDLPFDFLFYLRGYLLSGGFYEVKNTEFISLEEHHLFSSVPYVEIANPLSPDMRLMRTSLIPGLLRAGALNIRYGNDDVKLFEIGRIFIGEKGDNTPFKEPLHLGVFVGGFTGRVWYEKRRRFDFYDIKGVLDGLAEYLNKEFTLVESKKTHPGFLFSVDIMDGTRKLGVIGEVSLAVQKRLEVKVPLYVLELELEGLNLPALTYRDFSRFPSVWRDISVLVPRGTKAGDVLKLIRSIDIKELEKVIIVDVYDDIKTLRDKVSITFSLQFTSYERTLESGVVDRYMEKVIEVLKEHGYEQRA